MRVKVNVCASVCERVLYFENISGDICTPVCVCDYGIQVVHWVSNASKQISIHYYALTAHIHVYYIKYSNWMSLMTLVTHVAGPFLATAEQYLIKNSFVSCMKYLTVKVFLTAGSRYIHVICK